MNPPPISDRCDGPNCDLVGYADGISWRGDAAYLGASEIEVDLVGGKYSFSGTEECDSDLTSSNGKSWGGIVCGEEGKWVEDGLERLIYFEASETIYSDFFTVRNAQIKDQSNNELYWKTEKGAMSYPSDGSYHAFFCENVELNLLGLLVNQEGIFKAKDFVFGVHLSLPYPNRHNMDLFNPCGVDTCSAVDDVLKCNGKAKNIDIVYGRA